MPDALKNHTGKKAAPQQSVIAMRAGRRKPKAARMPGTLARLTDGKGKSIKQSRSSAKRAVKPFPFYAKVWVTQKRGVPAEAVGKMGVILGRAQSPSRQWNYSVFLKGLDESYSLPHLALTPTGEVLNRTDIYGGDKVRVVVDDTGAGSVASD